MDDVPEEIKYKIRDAVREVIESAKSEFESRGGEFPTDKRYIAPEDVQGPRNFPRSNRKLYEAIEEEYVLNFHSAIRSFGNTELDSLAEASKLIQEHELWGLDVIARAGRQSIYDIEGRDWDVEGELLVYKNDLLHLAGDIAAHQGGFIFNQDVFDKLFRHICVRLRGEPREFTVYVPIVNIDGSFESLELPTDFNFKNLKNRYQILSSELLPKSPNVLAALFNMEGVERIPRIDPDLEYRWSHFLKLNILGNPDRNHHRQYIKALGRCFRLLKPESQIAYMGPAYVSDELAISEHLNQPVFRQTSPPELTVGNVYTSKTYGLTISERYQLDSEEATDLSNFAHRYIKYLNPDRDDEITNTVRRYDGMFSNLYLEDQLMNCAIGFEGSLLRDIANTSSFTFRLKLRSGILLQGYPFSREILHRFVKSLYYVRSEIVHNDREIDELVKDINFDPPLEYDSDDLANSYSIFARVVLSKVILAYLDIEQDFGLGVTEANVLIDQKALETRLDFEEYESES